MKDFKKGIENIGWKYVASKKHLRVIAAVFFVVTSVGGAAVNEGEKVKPLWIGISRKLQAHPPAAEVVLERSSFIAGMALRDLMLLPPDSDNDVRESVVGLLDNSLAAVGFDDQLFKATFAAPSSADIGNLMRFREHLEGYLEHSGYQNMAFLSWVSICAPWRRPLPGMLTRRKHPRSTSLY